MNKKFDYNLLDNEPIIGSVSYIYYPYWGDVGHAEISIEDECWTLKKNKCRNRSLIEKISQMKKKNCHYWPFYRYIINVTKTELQQLKELSKKYNFLALNNISVYSPICSLEALNVLSQNTDFYVPFLFKLSPFMSYCYLSYKNLPCIRKIEYHGHKNTDYLMKIGIIKEFIVIGCIISITIIWSSVFIYTLNIHGLGNITQSF